MTDALRKFMSAFSVFDSQEIEAVIDSMSMETHVKGTLLLSEGEITSRCYFILKGCIREYQLLDGAEKNVAFFTEHQAVISYTSYLEQAPSQHYYACLEDCVLLAGTRAQEQALHKLYPRLAFLTPTILQKDYQQVQRQLAVMIRYSAKERYEHLLSTRPDLLQRVPLHHLASFIGVTPESFSRIRKRVANSSRL